MATTNEFLNSFGVNTHLAWRNWGDSPYGPSAYADTNRFSAALEYIHIGKIRESLPSITWIPDAMDVLAQKGVKFNLISYADYFSVADQVAMLRGFAESHPGAIVSVEGPNEPYNWPVNYGGMTGRQGALGFQAELYERIRQDDLLDGLRIYDVSDLAYTGPADAANFHAYNLSGGSGTAAITGALVTITGGSTENVVLTEIGWSTGRDIVSRNVVSGVLAPWESVDEATQARETIKTLISAFSMGIAETYIYELVDPFPRLTDSDLLWNFGLFNDDWSPKVAARALNAFGNILSDNTTGVVPASQAISPATLFAGELKVLTLAHHANRTDFIVWDDTDTWNDARDIAMTHHLSPVTMRFNQVMSDILVYDPMAGSAPVAHLAGLGEMTMWVGAAPMIISVFGSPSDMMPPIAAAHQTQAPHVVEINLFRKDILAMDLSLPILGEAKDAASGVSGWLLTSAGSIAISAASKLKFLDGEISYDRNDPSVRIEGLFHELFDRPAREFERSLWVDVWNTQGGFHAVLNGLLDTSNFSTYNSGAADVFVAGLYRDILNREPEQGGFDHAVAALQQGYSRVDIARNFYYSPEYAANNYPTELGVWSPDPVAQRTARLYFSVLDRAPDQGGFEFWTKLAREGYGFDKMVTGFTHSAEAGDRFQSQSDADYVSMLFNTVLDREPDAPGHAYWNQALANGWSRDSVMLAFSDCIEFQYLIAGQLQDGITFV